MCCLGVVDALTKVLVGLYESTDKPVQPLDFIRDYLGTSNNGNNNNELDILKNKIVELNSTIEKQQAEIESLKQQLNESTK